MIKDWFYRTLAYFKAVFTEDPFERTTLELIQTLERSYERRIAELELMNTTLQNSLRDKNEDIIKMQSEFITILNEHNKPEIKVDLPNPIPFSSRGWNQTRNNLERIARKNADKVTEAIENVEEDLFGPGTVDAFDPSSGTDSSIGS